MIINIILWTLVIVVGLPMFLIAVSIFLARFAVDTNESLHDPVLTEIEPEAVKGVPARKIRKLLSKAEEKGFRKVLGYTLAESAKNGMNNYIYVLFSADTKTYAEVYYLRAPILFRVLTLLFDREHFHHYLLNTAFFSAWDDHSRLVTAADPSVASDIAANDRSTVLKRSGIDQLLDAHQKTLAEMTLEHGEPLAFQSAEDYRRFFASRTRLAYESGPKSVEEVLSCEQI
jgi:hypothetical protein